MTLGGEDKTKHRELVVSVVYSGEKPYNMKMKYGTENTSDISFSPN